MQKRGFVQLFKPNVTSLGYGLFLGVNAASVWGGVFPFLPMEFQTSSILLWFSMGQSLVFLACYLLSALGAYHMPAGTRHFLVKLVSAPYFLGWVFLIAATYVDNNALTTPFAFVGGCLLGLGSAGFYMLWQRLFAGMDSDEGNRNLILGTVYGAIVYFLLYLIPIAVTVYLIPLVFMPLFGLVITLQSRRLDIEQPMFEDIPREHPQVYSRVVKDVWRSALCLGAIGFCTGIMRSMVIEDPAVGSLVNMMSMGAMLVAAAVLLVLWRSKNLRLNIISVYKVFFPFVISAFLVMPFLADTLFPRGFSAALYAVYSVAVVFMMMQCAQISRDRGVNPVFVYGLTGGIVYLVHDVGFIGGTLAEQVMGTGIPVLAIVSLVALYLLGFMFFVGQGGFGKLFSAGSDEAANIELVALQPSVGAPGLAREHGPGGAGASKERHADNAAAPNVESPAQEAALEARPEEPVFRDRLSKQVELVRRHYRLSAREAEVMELIARGTSVARIAEMLVVSENTVRTHSKRIYAKLDIHKRQDLLDLIDSFSPSELD